MKNKNTQKLTLAAMVAAAYAVLSLLGAVFGITYGPIQVRFSEALCLLPFLFPETAWAWAWAASSPTCSAPMECWISWWGPWPPLLPR